MTTKGFVRSPRVVLVAGLGAMNGRVGKADVGDEEADRGRRVAMLQDGRDRVHDYGRRSRS